MKTFTAGRFWAEVNGSTTTIKSLHHNGSGAEEGRLELDFDDLPDLRHVLERAIAAHADAPSLGAYFTTANWEQQSGPFCATCGCGGSWHYQGCGVGKARGDTHFVRKPDVESGT
jgi:hypothetical protein